MGLTQSIAAPPSPQKPYTPQKKELEGKGDRGHTEGTPELVGEIANKKAGYRSRLYEMHRSREKLQRFVPVPDHELGLITKVYDGDTITLTCEIAARPCSVPVRILGIDTPELHRGKSALEGEAAKTIRDLIADLCLGKFGTVTSCGLDKYGRLLAKVSIQEEEKDPTERGCVNVDADRLSFPDEITDLTDFLLAHGLAYAYEGATKKDFEEVDLERMIQKCGALRTQLGKPCKRHHCQPALQM